jgi:ABC-type nitrate/sulfonate/bicarbonate transport system, permease component
MSSSIANETVGTSNGQEKFTFYQFITNTYFLNAVSLCFFFLVWDRVADLQVFGDSLARPLAVLEKLIELSKVKFAGHYLYGHIWFSTQRVVAGFAIASVIAVPLGLFMAINTYANAIVKPIFDLFKPMPPIAWVALSILWFGIGESSKIFIIIIGTFVPCLLNAYNGVRLVEPELYDVVRVLGGNRKSEIFQVCFPAFLSCHIRGLDRYPSALPGPACWRPN